ncbi:hypothetical protein DCAR_0520833 [Daucus carota subsp. sativus]|uniref:BHLH domain-containing protein n=1 Tax=Daucus carota subsp. sativus TaxID=79200 RepID=A0AAF0X6W2_DAUCS|nr:PREDICTED: transcription factor LHW-like [Daucus carota subsp. sativus]WOH01449.1 hypothetical protein DCAR_0520833 [Daucus carota subsp. sativus]
MGYLLKEALKTLCGVNQWSYAVFWKIGCQNPKLLIWEECYYGPVTYSGVPLMPGIEISKCTFHDWHTGLAAPEMYNSLGFQGGDRVQLLVNKMMLDNHVNIVGEGLVGRAAFTGNYHWIHSQNYIKEYHPPEVLNEIHQQISAGMQTVAVIPVLPHGVVQLGSSSSITENMQFVNDVKTLILQLGYIPGVLFSDNFATTEPASELEAVVLSNSASTNPSGKSKALTSCSTDNYNQQNDSRALSIVGQTQDNPLSTALNFNHQPSVISNAEAQNIADRKPAIDQSSQLENRITGAESINSDPKFWWNEKAPSYLTESMVNQQPSPGPSATISGSRNSEKKLLVDYAVGCGNVSDASLLKWTTEGLISSPHECSGNAQLQKLSNPHYVLSGLSEISNVSSLSSVHEFVRRQTESEFQNGYQYTNQLSPLNIAKELAPNHSSPSSSDTRNKFQDKTCSQFDLDRGKEEKKNDMFHDSIDPFPPAHNHFTQSNGGFGFIHDTQKQKSGYYSIGHAQFEDAHVQSHSGDDLFDVFGMNFKNRLLDESWNNLLNDGTGTNLQYLEKNNHTLYKLQNASSVRQVHNEGTSDSDAFCVTSTDHLLDAVVSSVQPATKEASDDSLSCKTSLTKVSSAYAPTASTSCKRAITSNLMQEACIDLAKSLPKEMALKSCSFNYEPCKEESEIFSQSKSFYGSQSNSWIEQGSEIKQSTSSTAITKKPDVTSKSNRKRSKPGENPRPRPKDRQMIQDRVKELREIVPNSAKCSIDALLERTIKHMMFLQGVTKHADKLKQTGESKILNKEGGLLLKDNFEGGATWAYEVGSQSMVCPIIVEDLNTPRQMLVEMLCEERGLFLEIADIVKGLGLTILKGVLETRNNKIWAQFVVEANRDVTRMEIFLSLVRLLGHTVQSSAVSANGAGNDSAAPHQPLHPGVSIAATGRPCSFQ